MEDPAIFPNRKEMDSAESMEEVVDLSARWYAAAMGSELMCNYTSIGFWSCPKIMKAIDGQGSRLLVLKGRPCSPSLLSTPTNLPPHPSTHTLSPAALLLPHLCPSRPLF